MISSINKYDHKLVKYGLDTPTTIQSQMSSSIGLDLSRSLMPAPELPLNHVITMLKDIKEICQNQFMVLNHIVYSSTSFYVTLWLFLILVRILSFQLYGPILLSIPICTHPKNYPKVSKSLHSTTARCHNIHLCAQRVTC